MEQQWCVSMFLLKGSVTNGEKELLLVRDFQSGEIRLCELIKLSTIYFGQGLNGSIFSSNIRLLYFCRHIAVP